MMGGAPRSIKSPLTRRIDAGRKGTTNALYPNGDSDGGAPYGYEDILQSKDIGYENANE